MYRYKGYDERTSNGMAKSGTLVECLKLAKQNWKRLKIPGEIFRPDGSSIRDKALKVGL